MTGKRASRVELALAAVAQNGNQLKDKLDRLSKTMGHTEAA